MNSVRLAPEESEEDLITSTNNLKESVKMLELRELEGIDDKSFSGSIGKGFQGGPRLLRGNVSLFLYEFLNLINSQINLILYIDLNDFN